MRVLHIDAGREMRGGQWQVLYLLREHPGVLMAHRDAPLYERAHAEGIEGRELGYAALAKASGEADLVHAHDARAHTAAALLSRAPFVVSRRVAFPVKRGPASRWKYGRAAHYLAVSEFVKRTIEAADVPSEKITVVYDAAPLPGSLSARLSGRVVAPVFDDPRKGTDLTEAAARLAGVSVTFSRDLISDLSDAALFVYLTRSEGLGSAALLAMAHGVPVIASRVGGLPEAAGDAGLLVENDPAAVAGAIRRVLDDRQLAAEMAGRGRRRAEECFSVRRMAERTQAVYRKVLGC